MPPIAPLNTIPVGALTCNPEAPAVALSIVELKVSALPAAREMLAPKLTGPLYVWFWLPVRFKLFAKKVGPATVKLATLFK